MSQLYLRQFLAGRDLAVADSFAEQMRNFIYAVGDRQTGECVLVDPAYAIDELLGLVGADGMTVVGAVASHYHQDHVGGSLFGVEIEGVAALLQRIDCPVHVQSAEVQWVTATTGIDASTLVGHRPNDTISVGAIDVELLHTPGHTPGSQCLLVDGQVITGDTLFLDGCGRTDLPGSDPAAMYDSLQRLANLPADTVVLPGHHYSPPASGTLGAITEANVVFRPASKTQWLTMFGA